MKNNQIKIIKSICVQCCYMMRKTQIKKLKFVVVKMRKMFA